MNLVITILICALIVESVWETLKMLWQEGKVSVDKVGALVVALIVCFGTQLNLLSLFEISIHPWIGIILTAILVSRGSSFVHDLIKKVNQLTTNDNTPL